ncbi:MAG: pilus assembly protein PilM [Calditerrivibrio sp.]|nr:pilus assembly protein PilM [Calditerrivibrio sp.]MCA1933608.1 pilus assembly protein PilM [Calditerrivibrio sp.]MCA1980635.1 pilus assembly protein PilM [Calditerrivibrio sp.]
MFGKSGNLVGLDIGSNSIKIVELAEGRSGYSIKSIGYKELPRDVISEGSIIDVAEIVNSLNEIFKERKISNNNVAIGLKGNTVIAKRIHIPGADSSLLEEEFRYQAQQFIQMDIEDVNIDYHIVKTDEESSMTDVILAVARKDVISGMLSTLGFTKLKVSVVDLEVFALANAYELTYGINSDVNAILNLGHSSSIIVFIKNGYYEFSREISMGGKDCIEMIQKKLGVTYDSARLIMNDGDAIEFNEDLQRVISDFNTQLGYEIKHSLDIFYSTTKYSTSKIFICGGLAKLFDLKGAISRTSDLPVEEFNPFVNVDISSASDYELVVNNPYLFNTALGLALRKVKDR